MRVDVVSIFPGYLDALDLSLVGKARRDGVLDLRVHDLRDWTTDRHRTVDDTPFGGGAGMVMRPDVWGRALDDVLGEGGSGRTVLVLPTPSGERLTQRSVEDLATADRLVIACGRYEGIDARVADHYAGAEAPEVREISLGDYVLNGGEVAALVVVEAVARLLPGVVGNPESLVEESHGTGSKGGLLEYPVYTKPAEWAGRPVPDVLLSGHHGKVARWRRDQALERTVRRRPDLIEALEPAELDRGDRAVLARHGWFLPAEGAPVRVRVRPGRSGDADALAELAAATFPLACPPELGEADIAAFVAENLGAARFASYLTDARYRVQVAETSGGLVGYTLVVLPSTAEEPPDAEDVAALVPDRPAAELSKCYVLPAFQGSGVAGALLEAVRREVAAIDVEGRPVAVLWLGTNAANRRARAGYGKHGYTTVGPRRFQVGEQPMEDVVMALGLTAEPGDNRR
ncbi:hypothetical protein GCM10023169_18880 [Georgenia halophila]|uniref:tRNA (guanine-N(1)-)-methyltransferase n=1 Tax=Georgenia halophila TaxID=620889 RepID=A0ABP8L7Y8_9MICO